jgi:Lon protease-like protein
MRYLEVSEIIPAMRLPDTVFFPYTILPLYIFEPKYQVMLEEVLEDGRMFTILSEISYNHLRVPDIQNRECVTLGCVRACQTYKDGTALVLLEGLCRVEIVEYLYDRNYTRVRIRNRTTINSDPSHLEILKNETLNLLKKIKKHGGTVNQDTLTHLREIEKPQVFIEQAAASLVQNPLEKHNILQSKDPVQRYSTLLNRLRKDLRQVQLLNQIWGNRNRNQIRNN